jgi:hypothetical protein
MNNTSVVVWAQSSGATNAIYAQRLVQKKMSASKVGSPTFVASGQVSEPSVAMDSKGDFVVTWSQKLGGGMFTASEIAARRFSAGGAAIGSPFAVAFGPQPVSDSHVAEDAAGDFVVSYTVNEGYLGDTDIKAKLYQSSGTLKKSINVAVSPKDESNSSVAMHSNGYFQIVYEVAQTSKNHDVVRTEYTADGLADFWGLIAYSPQNETTPSVSAADDGSAGHDNSEVIVYRKQNGPTDSIIAFYFDGDKDHWINIATHTVAMTPTVAIRPDGKGFAVAYVVAPTSSGEFFLPQTYVTEVDAKGKVKGTHLAGKPGQQPIGPGLSIDSTSHYLLSDQSRNGSSSSPFVQFGGA